MTVKLQDRLAYAPRGLRADRAAAYLGMSRTKFLELVDSGRMPDAMVIDSMKLWDRFDLDAAIEEIKASPDEPGGKRNTFDKILSAK